LQLGGLSGRHGKSLRNKSMAFCCAEPQNQVNPNR